MLTGLSCLLTPALALAAAPDFSSLVHHWNFDEGPDWHDSPFRSADRAVAAHDSVGGVSLKLPAGSLWVSGRQYTAVELNAHSGGIETSRDLAPVLGGDMSLSFWMNTAQPVSGKSGQTPVIFGSADFQPAALDAAGHLAVAVDGKVMLRSPAPVNDGQWHFVVVTRSAKDGGLGLQVDAPPMRKTKGPGGRKSQPVKHIASMDGRPGSSFRGRLDQIHLFRAVIDAATIAKLADNHAPKAWPVTAVGESGKEFTTPSVTINTHVYDAEQDPVTLASFDASTAPHFWITANADGSFRALPEQGYIGEEKFQVILSDGNGGHTRNTVTLVVHPPHPPQAKNRSTRFTAFREFTAGGAPANLAGLRVPRFFQSKDGAVPGLLASDRNGLQWFENTGTRENPGFAAGRGLQAGGEEIPAARTATFALADLNGDGLTDLVGRDAEGRLFLFPGKEGTSAAPSFEAPKTIMGKDGDPFLSPDPRFDLADWDGDGRIDLITGNHGGPVLVHFNTGSAAEPVFDPENTLELTNNAYNLHPRVLDLNLTGQRDLILGINWGAVNCWFDPPAKKPLPQADTSLTITDADGRVVDLRPHVDGAVVDFADINGDGVLDLIVGGHAGKGLWIAEGVRSTVADSIAAIEKIYDAHPKNLGAALDADDKRLLEQIRTEAANIKSQVLASSPGQRAVYYEQLAAHVGKYPFLQLSKPLDVNKFHHVPSIAGQNLVTLAHTLPDTPENRKRTADVTGLTGLHREIFLQMGLHVGDNQTCSRGQLEAIRDFMRQQPRESFPDDSITIDHYFGDGSAGRIAAYTSNKNTFSSETGNNVGEWAGDLARAVSGFFGRDSEKGDYFTLVMAHEVTHSLDAYVATRANRDLLRRRDLVLQLATGPDVLAPPDGKPGAWDLAATKERFRERGHWDGKAAGWDEAWKDYWKNGPGSRFQELSFMRGNIDWFLGAVQEVMATQANHHWVHSEGRLTGAIARWRRAEAENIPPLKANLTEALTFLDWISCGMNKIVMQDTEGVQKPYPRAAFHSKHAWLERDDLGRITRLLIDGRDYRFKVNGEGVTTGIQSTPDPSLPRSRRR